MNLLIPRDELQAQSRRRWYSHHHLVALLRASLSPASLPPTACEGTARAFWIEAIGYLRGGEEEEQHFYIFFPLFL